MTFWDTPRHGGNSFNRLPPDQAYFDALRHYGASWVRLSYDKWQPAQRDFLLGDADAYQGLPDADLATLRATLDRAHQAGLKVVIAPLSLPGMRWSQNNQGQFDDRLWQDKRYWLQAAAFWRDMARELKGHPAIAAYNLINEPAPEKHGGLAEHAEPEQMRQWYAQQQGSARDLPALYRQLIAAIREEDADTPVMVDAGWFAGADAFGYWPALLHDQRVLYSVHMYEPYAATSAPNMTRKQPFAYPGPAPFAGQTQQWDGQRVARYLRQPLDWAEAMKVPRARLVVGEFGCMRRLPGCRQYLDDVLNVLERQQLHWAFYSFREDNWDGMDYELGSAKVPWRYWQAIEQGAPDPLVRKATAEFEPIRRRLNPD
ncbi:cellulase family glycosylhydrolase [Pseudomonas sp. AFG_SD02_1510_Pfu_092]|uniref:glycoside hydrolase family 5 protein n=1 Tax=Pseudomonas sp. AFG_SD02_1510_Pfu_092 TaxID=2259497 RepID=UPI001F4EC71A|nr:cellulase family glycosylhydrolase [Pseudomonas sp. AFG_SD02_1510_Pfu_092]